MRNQETGTIDLQPTIERERKAERSREGSLDEISKEILGLSIKRPRFNDGRDFHDLSTWRIKKALEEAYAAGIVTGYGYGTSKEGGAA